MINYTYDGLNRLTAADYESGTYYHYTYDAVGNRLNETRKPNSTLPEVVNTYDYDNANRLTKVNEINYSWDANGNLLSDGVNTYTYDSANRLTHLVNTKDDISYAYNGQGDRISKTSAGQTTNYKLDMNAGLTQVLDDGTSTYLYGVGRISQENDDGVSYFLGDALGNVRQLVSDTSPDVKVTLTREYSPYGEIVSHLGAGKTDYGFTGELQDGDFVHLRARDYTTADGRFLSRDNWEGDNYSPISYNKYLYTSSNPINAIDPSGNQEIVTTYSVKLLDHEKSLWAKMGLGRKCYQAVWSEIKLKRNEYTELGIIVYELPNHKGFFNPLPLQAVDGYSQRIWDYGKPNSSGEFLSKSQLHDLKEMDDRAYWNKFWNWTQVGVSVLSDVFTIAKVVKIVKIGGGLAKVTTEIGKEVLVPETNIFRNPPGSINTYVSVYTGLSSEDSIQNKGINIFAGMFPIIGSYMTVKNALEYHYPFEFDKDQDDLEFLSR